MLRRIVSGLREKYGAGGVFVTASTGIAACNIGGITLHSFAGIGIGEGSLAQMIKKVKRNTNAQERWQQCEALIIDGTGRMQIGGWLTELNALIAYASTAFGFSSSYSTP